MESGEWCQLINPYWVRPPFISQATVQCEWIIRIKWPCTEFGASLLVIKVRIPCSWNPIFTWTDLFLVFIHFYSEIFALLSTDFVPFLQESIHNKCLFRWFQWPRTSWSLLKLFLEDKTSVGKDDARALEKILEHGIPNRRSSYFSLVAVLSYLS